MYWVWWLVIAAAALAVLGFTCMGLIIFFEDNFPSDETVTALTCVSGIPAVIAFLICIVSIIVGGCGEYDRVHQPLYWQEFSTMCQDVIDSGNVITNRDMTVQIIRYNAWLVDARADQQTKGKWSKWHDIDLSNFQYITLKDGTEFDINIGSSNN